MEQQFKGYENYPLFSVLIDNLVAYSSAVVGMCLLYLINPWFALVLFCYVLYIEWTIFKDGCVHCYYYGKVCHSGKGKLAPLMFKKGDPKVFCEKSVSFKDFFPQMLGSVVPIVAGIYLLVTAGFNWLILGLTLWPIVSWFVGNPIIFGQLACPHCRQAEICCPVYKMFAPKDKSS